MAAVHVMINEQKCLLLNLRPYNLLGIPLACEYICGRGNLGLRAVSVNALLSYAEDERTPCTCS